MAAAAAQKEIAALLSKIYKDRRNPGSFTGIDSLYREARKINGQIKKKDIVKFLEGERTYGLFKSRRLRFPRSRTFASGYYTDAQADLAGRKYKSSFALFLDFQSLATKNEGFRYLLVLVDVLSRRVFAQPIKAKTTVAMEEAFDELFERQMPQPPARLFTDQGKEFESEAMHKFFKDKWMIDKRCSTDKSVKAGVAERMIRTIKERLYRYFSENNTENWVDAIADIVHAINHNVCRVTGMRPIDIREDNADALWQNLYGKEYNFEGPRASTKFKPNDKVRLALEKTVFRKGTLPTFTDEIFQVDEVAGSATPHHYYLRDHKGERIKGRVYAPELTKVREDSETTYRIDRVLERKKKRNGKTMLLVKFIGYPDSYWINESEDIV
jgi:hypothetical protein